MIREDYIRVDKTNCPKCGSRDNLAVYTYDDGSTSQHCFTPGCSNHVHSLSPQDVDTNPVDLRNFVPYTRELLSRKLSLPILNKYGVLVNPREKQQAYPYYKDGSQPTSAKIRTVDKRFFTTGNHKSPWLYGQWIGDFQPEKRKVLIITEGELDALAAHQMTGWASVSVPRGAQSALKDVKNNLKWIEKFDKVYICFDNDEPGQLAAEEVMNLIIAGKAFNVTLTRAKDPCGYLLLDNGTKLFKDALDAARGRSTNALYTDDNFKWDDFLVRDEQEGEGFKCGIEPLDDVWSMRPGEITTMFSDPSVGKSSIARQMGANWLRKYQSNILYFTFEESVYHYYKKMMLMITEGNEKNLKEVGNHYKPRVQVANVSTYDIEKVKEAITYAVRCHGVKLVIFDNITSHCIGRPDFAEAVRTLYGLLVSLGKEYGHHTVVVSHTKRDSALKAGVPPAMSAAFGTSGIEQFSDTVISLGREEGVHETWFAIRKQRYNGEVGESNRPLKWDTLKKCFKDLDLTPVTYNGEADIGTNEVDNGREPEQEAREFIPEKTEAEIKPTVKSPRELKEIWESRVSNGRGENGEIRQQNGGSNPRGFKPFQRQGIESRQNSKRNQTFRGRNFSKSEVQSRLSDNSSIWENYISGSQRELTRVGQAPPPELTTFLEGRETLASRVQGFPFVAPSC